MPIERKHRLPEEAYHGPKTVAFTACAEDRVPFLANDRLVEAFVQILAKQATRFNCLVPVYCFMPDHLHLLMQGISEESRPKVAMDEFKEFSGKWLFSRLPGCDWQANYHDHIIRGNEDWKGQAFYILNNPVRKHLVEDPFDYPYTGSIGYDLRTLFGDLPWA